MTTRATSSSARQSADRTVRAATVSVFAIFVLNGFNFANWASRIPAVRDELSLSAAQIGLLLLVGSIGSLLALPLAGIVVQRLGAARTVVLFAGANTAGLLIAATGVALGQLPLVGVGLVLFGVGTGVWDAAMNIEGAAVEQRLGKAIMPRFHAGFSFGTMAGAGVGALAAYLHASVLGHLALALGLSLVGACWAVRWFLPVGIEADVATPAGSDARPGATSAALPADVGGGLRHDVTGARSAFGAWLEPRTLLIGLVVFGAALTEGSANDWVGLAVVDGFAQTNAAGALTFALFVTAMTGMRLLGTGLLDRYGRVPVLRLCAVLSIAGLLIFGLVPNLQIALVGVVLWGAGAALGFPVGMSAASDDPLRAAARVSVVSTVGYTAFLAGPPLLGFLAAQVGYRHALLAIAVPVVIGLFVLPALAPLPTAAGAQRTRGGPA